jgi:HSP20 family protein
MSYLMRRDPFRGLVRMQDEMDRLFQHLFGEERGGEHVDGVRVPAIDLSETEEEVVVKAEVPGVSKEQLDLEVLPEVLVLKAEMSETKEQAEGAYHRRERIWRRFERSIPLPVEVKTEGVTAKLTDGVLEIHMAKSERAKTATPRKITVE